MRQVRRVILVIIVVSAFGFFGDQACGQMEPPTMEQCRADAQLWLEQSGFTTGYYYKLRQNLRALTVRQLVDRKQHMVDCRSVDPENTDSFLRVIDAYDLEIGERYGSFIVRNDLAGQFHKEDDAGLR